jgi:hypothetical protein
LEYFWQFVIVTRLKKIKLSKKNYYITSNLQTHNSKILTPNLYHFRVIVVDLHDNLKNLLLNQNNSKIAFATNNKNFS